jgi:hypothetical protein
VLAVDMPGRLIKRAMEAGILQQLHLRQSIPEISLYAHDVVLFCHPSRQDAEAIKAILQLIGTSSGLMVNYAKSSATMLHCEPADAMLSTNTLGCRIAELPLTYLGIPLTVGRPTASQLQPVVDKTAGMLPSWKSKLMNKAGRLAFVKSMLSAIPIHQIMALKTPKKIRKLFEKMQRGFLWEGKTEANGGNCHVNWRTVSRPISLGGLGVQDIERASLALRLRWQWFAKTDRDRAWSGLDLQFDEEERDLFHASTYTIIGNGQKTNFWEDRWIDGKSVREVAPQLYACIPKRRRKARLVDDGLNGNAWVRDIQGTIGITEIGQYLMLWRQIEHLTLSEQLDKLIWKWTLNGLYSAQSAYLATFQVSTSCNSWRLIWKTWAPSRVNFFHWLTNKDRCWTAERLRRHCLQHHPRCLLCDQEPESMHHLLIACPFARQAWHDVLSWLRMTCQPPHQEASLNDWWINA